MKDQKTIGTNLLTELSMECIYLSIYLSMYLSIYFFFSPSACIFFSEIRWREIDIRRTLEESQPTHAPYFSIILLISVQCLWLIFRPQAFQHPLCKQGNRNINQTECKTKDPSTGRWLNAIHQIFDLSFYPWWLTFIFIREIFN